MRKCKSKSNELVDFENVLHNKRLRGASCCEFVAIILTRTNAQTSISNAFTERPCCSFPTFYVRVFSVVN